MGAARRTGGHLRAHAIGHHVNALATVCTLCSSSRGPRLSAASFAALLLAGCTTVGPDYVPASIATPQAWHRIDPSTTVSPAPATADLSRWWSQFGDPVLSGLIERALAANTDLRIARSRLQEARARRALAQASGMPTLGASASAARSRDSEEAGRGSTTELYRAGLDANWEADVFGARRRGIEAAQADLDATTANLHAVQVTLTAEVALNYIDLRAFQTRLEVARRNLEAQTDIRQLTDWRAQAGLLSALESEQARTVLERTRAQIPSLEAGLAQAQDRVAALLAIAPGALDRALFEARTIPTMPERIGVDIPAEVLRQRPDVRAAERRVAADTARIGQAEAALYPQFRLSGSIGLEALRLGALGSSGALASSLLVGVSGVLFDGGRLRSQVAVQEAVRDQALAAYEGAIVTALQEVESALALLQHGRTRLAVLGDAVQAARNAALYATQRYRSGIVDFQAVLDTQRAVLDVEDALAAARADNASAVIRLFKALGGGWAVSPADTVQPIAGETS